MRMYEIKMWTRDSPSTPAYRFYIHDDRSVEMVKEPTILKPADMDMLIYVRTTMMQFMENSNIADMNCNYIRNA